MATDAALQDDSQTELELELKRLIVDALKLEDVSAEDIDSSDPLVGEGLGLDSIDILELAMAIHRSYGVKTGSDDTRNREIYANVASLAAFIRETKSGIPSETPDQPTDQQEAEAG